MIILGHHYVTILFAKMLIWAPFSQSMFTFISVLTLANINLEYNGKMVDHVSNSTFISTLAVSQIALPNM